MAMCKGCDCEAEEGEQFCGMCEEELRILSRDFLKYEFNKYECVGGCREGCSHDPRHL